MFWSQFLTIALVHFVALVSPGPDFAMITRNSLLYSRASGVYTSIGLALGIATHVAYCLLGIGLLISQSILLFSVIKYIGAAYLLYIGYKSLKAKPEREDEPVVIQNSEKTLTPLAAIRSGYLTNVLNPKATLFLLAVFTQVIDPVTPKLIQSLYGVEMVVVTFAWFSVVSVFLSHGLIQVKIMKFKHRIEHVTGVVLIALGIKVALASHK